MRMRVLHLVDDTTAGGVMQVVRHLTTDDGHAAIADHRIAEVRRGSLSLPELDADVIVSHLTVAWRCLPALALLRLRSRGRLLIHVEHSYTAGFVRHNVKRRGRFMAMLRLAYSRFDRVVAVSAAQSSWLLRNTLVRKGNLRLIRSCTDLSKTAALPPATGPVRHFGAIGRLERQKGFDLLIAAFRQTTDPDLRLTIFGTGSEQQSLAQLADGDNRVTFAGHTDTPAEAYAQVDAVIMPSRWEAYGLVAVETLCAGRRLICGDVDGLRDHADLGATIVPEITAKTFIQGQNATEGRLDGAWTAQRLMRENLLAWHGLLSEARKPRMTEALELAEEA